MGYYTKVEIDTREPDPSILVCRNLFKETRTLINY